MTERKFTFKKPGSSSDQPNILSSSSSSSIKTDLFKKKPEVSTASISSCNNSASKSAFPKAAVPQQRPILSTNSPKLNPFSLTASNKLKTNSESPAKPKPFVKSQSKPLPASSSGDQLNLFNFFNSGSKNKENQKAKPAAPKPPPQQIADSDPEEESDDDFLKFINSKNPVLASKPAKTVQSTVFTFGDKRPVATVKPQVNPQISVQKQNSIEHVIKPKPVEFTKKDTVIAETPEKKRTLSYEEYCQICEAKYDLVDKTSQKRKVTDACGHFICLSCLLKGQLCKKCHDSDQDLKSSKEFDEPVKSTIETKKPDSGKKSQSALNGYLAGLEDEFFYNENDFLSNEAMDNFSSQISIDSDKEQTTMKQQKKTDSNTEKLFELGAKLTTKSLVVKPAPFIERRDLVYVDSDDDLIIEESISSSIPINAKPATAKPKMSIMDSVFDYDEDALLPLNNSDDDDDDIDELDEEELRILNSNMKNKHRQLGGPGGVNNGSNNDIIIPDLSTYENSNWLFNDIKDCSPLYHRVDYPHTNDLFDSFRNLFGLKRFRAQQFEAVNAALLGHHCFVLMPTGGGKSLCYQLPAILTKGVTFIVSPLKSLIIDQVQKLNALNLPAAHLLSEANGKSSECEYIYMDLNKKEPTLRLVYVTPEKLNNSEKLNRIMSSLYARDMIARLVIDEAHCVSTWGHDFRPDYKQLGAIRNRLFPTVPMMLLTATATPRVRKDILLQMNLLCENVEDTNQGKKIIYNKNQFNGHNNNNNKQFCAFFIQSFNRTNLHYSVEYKTSNKAALDKILNMIKKKFPNKCGIVYCISRNECESVSQFLRKNGLKSLAYHAGMTDKQRNDIQHKWTNNIDCKIVCATIAFGMGIDKADVRFVIHLGLPKSLEGYYQESGRAGRDGLNSACILFYNNQDRHKWLRLMKQEQTTGGYNYEVYKVHLDNLYRMSQYCDNHTDCRRAQILEYFGEIFDRRKCIEKKETICDNCLAFTTNAFTLKDITQEAISIIKGVRELDGSDVTLLHISEILKGSMNSKVVEKQHNHLEMHGKLGRYKKTDIERVIRKLIFDGYLKEDVKIISHTDTVASYIKLGSKAGLLLNGKAKIEFDLRNTGESQEDDATADDGDCTDTDSSRKKTGANSKAKNNLLKPSASKTPMLSTNNSKYVNKIDDLTAQNRILIRCRNDLKQLAKRICTDKCIKNVNSIFTGNMMKEMILNMPQTRDELLRITHFTEAIYLNYNGEEFLAILKHYSKQLDDLRLCEALDNPESDFSKATSLNVGEANDLFENEGEDWLMSKSSGNNNGSLKRNAQNNSFNSSSFKKPTKKARNDDSTSSYFSNNGSKSYSQSGSQGGGGYKSKKKFWKFKKNAGGGKKFYKKN